MTGEQARELLRRYLSEVWDAGDVEAVRRFAGPGFRRHLSPTLPPLDLDGQLTRLRGIRQAFPDIAVALEDVVAEGDRIAFRSTLTGTHQGEFAGIPATGQRVAVTLVDVIRVDDGLIAEQWGGPDVFDMLRQVGARPTL